GACIVVQPAHDQRIDRERHMVEVQIALYRREMFATGFTQIVSDLWRASDFCQVLRLFTVKQAKWVLIEAYLAVLAAILQQWTIIVLQLLDIVWSAILVADAVNIDLEVLQPEPRIDLVEQTDQFSIDGWIFLTQRFAAKLMVFAVTPRLWPFAAKHRQV